MRSNRTGGCGRLLASAGWGLVLLPVLLETGAQAQEVLRLKLKVKEQVSVSGSPAPAFFDSIRCDGRGSLYARIVTEPDLLLSPVTKITREGKVQAVFSSTAVSGFEKAQLINFAVGLRGEVYGLVARSIGGGTETDILTFDDDGGFQFATKVEAKFTPSRIAVFPSGQFLLFGWREIRGAAPALRKAPAAGAGSKGTTEVARRVLPPVEALAAVIDRGGRMMKEVSLGPGAESPERPGSGGGNGVPSAEISLGEAVAGDDGNIYLTLRAPSAPRVYVISPAGTILRSFEVRPPGVKDQEISMGYSAGGKLVFEFQHPIDDRITDWRNAIFSIVDAETGVRELDYQSSADIGGGLSCYSPNDGFTFLRNSPDGRILITRAGP